MSMQTITNCVLILAGAVIMLLSLVKTRETMKLAPFIPERHRNRIKRYLVFHRGLMFFFLVGYIVVLMAFALHYSLLSETFVSIIFLLGAIFVFIGIDVQSQLLAEVQQTLQGILPICAKCKKIRIANGDPRDPAAWQKIETYIMKRVSVEFSHGYCPECFAGEMKKVDDMKRKQ